MQFYQKKELLSRVNGKALDANETSLIKAGDEIYIADVGYVFE